MADKLQDIRNEARDGNTVAMMQLSAWYETGEEGLEKSPFLSYEWMRKAAEHGDVDAQLDVGRRYQYGTGPVVDYSKALYWYKKAFSNGSGDACWHLATWFEKGEHLPLSLENAIAFYEEGAKRGSALCAQQLAYRYLDGAGVPRDGTRAMELFEQAGAGGQGSAYEALGVIYLSGDIVPRNPDMAFDLFGRALLYFDTDPSVAVGDAALHYAFCFLTGTGTPEDRKTGTEILQKAAEAGNPGATEIIATKKVRDPMMQIYYAVDGADLFKKPVHAYWDVSDLLVDTAKSSFL